MSGDEPGELFGEQGATSAPPAHTTGLLPSQEIRALMRAREVRALQEIGEDQIQPASLDLRLGSEAWRVRSSFLPGPGPASRTGSAAFGMHRIDLARRRGAGEGLRLRRSA